MPFRTMRRSRQALTEQECAALLARGTSGVLALHGDAGYPYAVPLSYVHADGQLFFHCAPAGHKLDALERCDKASFCVIGRDEVLPEKFTTLFASVIVFGRLRRLTSEAEKRRALTLLAERFSPGLAEDAGREIDRLFPKTCALSLHIEHISGKQAIELARSRA